jgi:hypothetical protein
MTLPFDVTDTRKITIANDVQRFNLLYNDSIAAAGAIPGETTGIFH